MRRAGALAVAVLLSACGGCPEVSVEGPSGEERLRVCVEEAATADERRDGLAGRAPLDGDEGLLLIFPAEGEVCIDNGGVGFSIDAVYADGSGRVVAVERALPANDRAARCATPVARVLEVAAGVADLVAEGDVLR